MFTFVAYVGIPDSETDDNIRPIKLDTFEDSDYVYPSLCMLY